MSAVHVMGGNGFEPTLFDRSAPFNCKVIGMCQDPIVNSIPPAKAGSKHRTHGIADHPKNKQRLLMMALFLFVELASLTLNSFPQILG